MDGRNEFERIAIALTDLYESTLVAQVRASAGPEAAELVSADLAGIARQVAIRLVGQDPVAAADAAEIVRAVLPPDTGDDFERTPLGLAVRAAEGAAAQVISAY
ncbi:hypothetical protein GFY24_30515 [Nocardia sp. SYP-A9097]|uniref:hypothetical protein n=1 Tax=Nocardia sp. SYP-A9097 TaxID=2663237 RepID=UPI00129BB42E|nr:hypothetical protein [Nocardia sp. SYP-A9097]MRH91722.1 hypothetical protein [Nocardia sp. SYP-A9097]